MKSFEIDYSYKLPEYGAMTIDALDAEEAEVLARKQIKEITADEVVDIEIDAVRELKI